MFFHDVIWKPMPRPKNKDGEGMGNPLNLRVKDEKKGRLEAVAKIMNTSVAELARLCVDIGLCHLERVDYDLAKTIVDAVEKQGTPPPPPGETGGAPPSREPASSPVRNVRYTPGTEGLGIRSAHFLNEEPPPNPLPEVGSQAWQEAKTALEKIAKPQRYKK